MFVVGIFGGLASQMSQYTFRTALERHYPDVVFKLAVASDFQNIIQHNGFELDRVFGIKKDTADWYTITKLANFCARNDWKGKILNKYMLVKTAVNGGKASQITLDDPSIYYPEIFELNRIQSKLFWGDWSERYFEEIVPEMKNIFTFQKPLNGINLDLYHSMTNCNSVAIHVRGGDYLTTGFLMLSIEYYKKAISYIMERISNPQFYIFTDDMGIKYGVKNYISLGTSLPSDFNFYSFTKGKFSDFGQYLCKTDDFNFADLKLEMFYGDTSKPKSRFIDICISKLLNNEELLLTSGYQKRDIIHVNDVVEIISRIIISNFVEGYKQLPVGTGEHHSIKEIVLYLKDEIGSDSELKFGAIKDRKNEPDTLADISWLKIIDYQLKYGYFEGLKSACISRGGGGT